MFVFLPSCTDILLYNSPSAVLEFSSVIYLTTTCLFKTSHVTKFSEACSRSDRFLPRNGDNALERTSENDEILREIRDKKTLIYTMRSS